MRVPLVYCHLQVEHWEQDGGLEGKEQVDRPKGDTSKGRDSISYNNTNCNCNLDSNYLHNNQDINIPKHITSSSKVVVLLDFPKLKWVKVVINMA